MDAEIGPVNGYGMAVAEETGVMTARDGPFYMCECHVTNNFFVKSVGMHFTYHGDDAEFLRAYAGLLPVDGPSPLEVLEIVRAQREERLGAPAEALSRADRIAREHTRLHPEVYTLDSGSFLADGFLELVSTLRGCGRRPSEVFACIEQLKGKGILKEAGPGLWSFECFTVGFCNLLEAELDHFRASGLPQKAPNTMNRYGIILSELGFCPGLLDPLVFVYLDAIAGLLFPCHTETLDSYRAFTVLYDAAEDGDRELALHYDNSEVTLNVNIGGKWDGGQVTFYGLATSGIDGSGAGIDVVLDRGHGVFHAGINLHMAQPIDSGRRHNLIIWCRSSAVRNDMCPMCFKLPVVVPTTVHSHEGFTVPPCCSRPSLMQGQQQDNGDLKS